ncbi:hypothetical protein GCM10027586_04480 [Kineococcus gypseus]
MHQRHPITHLDGTSGTRRVTVPSDIWPFDTRGPSQDRVLRARPHALGRPARRPRADQHVLQPAPDPQPEAPTLPAPAPAGEASASAARTDQTTDTASAPSADAAVNP